MKRFDLHSSGTQYKRPSTTELNESPITTSSNHSEYFHPPQPTGGRRIQTTQSTQPLPTTYGQPSPLFSNSGHSGSFNSSLYEDSFLAYNLKGKIDPSASADPFSKRYLEEKISSTKEIDPSISNDPFSEHYSPNVIVLTDSDDESDKEEDVRKTKKLPNRTDPIDLSRSDDESDKEEDVRKTKKLKHTEIVSSSSKNTTPPYQTPPEYYMHHNIPAKIIGNRSTMHIPKGTKIITLEEGASANIVRLLPTEIKLIILGKNISPDLMNAIPPHITILQINPATSDESLKNIPPHITKVLACNFIDENLKNPTLDNIEHLMIRVPDLLSEREAFYKEHLDIV